MAGKVCFVELTYPRTTKWSVEDYASGIEAALRSSNIKGGWLLGESFGSQPAWAMISRSGRGESDFSYNGLILAGGFVKHPWPWGARFLRWVTRHTPIPALKVLLKTYAAFARFRHRQAPETRTHVAQFVENRLHPEDPAAMIQRYTIVSDCDLRAVAGSLELPVFQLAGLVDPIVPAPIVRRWLRKNCPGFRESKTIVKADHNVLATAPKQSADIVLKWVRFANASPATHRT